MDNTKQTGICIIDVSKEETEKEAESIFFFKFVCLFVCLAERETEREHTRNIQAGGAAEEKGKAGSPLSREPETGPIPGLWHHDPS